MRRYYVVILALVSVLTGAQAQESERGLRVRALAVAYAEGLKELSLRAGERDLGTLKLAEGQLRKGRQVAARTFFFGTGEGEEFRALGEVRLSAAGRDFVLVFIPDGKGYRAFPVRLDEPGFTGKDTYLINLSPRHLGIMLGDARHQVGPGKSAVLRAEHAAGATFYRALFTYREGENYRPFNHTRWPVNENTRAMVFVYENEERGGPAYRSVTLPAPQS